MIEYIAGSFATFFNFAMIAIIIENVVFARSLGISRLLKLVDDNGVDTIIFCILLTMMQLLTAPVAYFAQDYLFLLGDLRYYIRPLFYIVVSCAVFALIMVAVHFLIKGKTQKLIKDILPMSAFNCSVFGTMYLCGTSFETIVQAMGYAVGASAGYLLATLIVTEGQHLIFKKEVPNILRGLPIMLIYLGILALAIYGFSGHSII